MLTSGRLVIISSCTSSLHIWQFSATVNQIGRYFGRKWSQRVINFIHFLILQREILWKLIVLIHILIQLISRINHGEKAVLASLSAFFTLPHSRLEIEWGPVEWISCGFLSHFPGACPQAPTTRVPHSRLGGRARNSGTRDTRLLKGLMCKGHLLKEEIL